jgi:AcrR family transcriptional regulator
MARHVAGVAARLFATRGYDATSVREIVEQAGITKPTLYYHFGSKEGLAQALFTVPMTRLVERLRAALDGPGGPVEQMEAIAEAHFAFCGEDPDRSRFAFALYFGPQASGLAAEMGRFGDVIMGLWDELARRLAATGVVAPGRAESCATALRGTIVIHMMDFLYRDTPLGPDLSRRLVGDLLGGFGAAGNGRG